MSRCGRLLCSLPVLIAALWAIRPACAGPVSAHAEPIVGDSPTAMVNANEDTAWAPVIPMPDVPAPLADSSFTTGVQPFVVPMRPAPSSEPPIIAAPLPPALLSGLIGLAGVYVYRRRQRIR